MESWISDLGLQRSVAKSRIALMPQYSLQFAREHGKPYFGRQLSAFQSPPVRYALMAELTRYALAGKARVRVLEVGSWAGASVITFGAVIRELQIPDVMIICIDQWKNSFVDEDRSLHYQSMNAAITNGEIQELFHHNINACGLADMVEIKKASSKEVLHDLESGAFDLVYIDGSHKKDDVLCDLEQAKRLVRSGGLICGDDLELMKEQIDLDAHNVALEKNIDFVADPRTGISYHPGVTEAIARMFDGVWQQYGLWCLERSGEQWHIPDFRPSNLEIPIHLQHAAEIPYGLFNEYEIFRRGDEFAAYPMASPQWFQNRIVCSSMEELVLLLDAIDRIDQVRSPRIVESRNNFNIVSYKRKSWVVDQSVGILDFRDQEQLRRLTASGQLFETETMEEARATADRMRINEASAPHIVESRNGFNIVNYNGKGWIIDQSVGSVDFRDQEQLKQLTASGQLFEMESMAEAKAAVDRMQDDEVSSPHIAESRSGFNIVNYKGKIWIVDRSVGIVDFYDLEQLKRLLANESVIEAETLSEARAIVDKKRQKEPTVGGNI